MALLIIGLIMFLGLHFSLRFKGLRENIEKMTGKTIFRIIFSMIAVFSLIVIISGYIQYRPNAPKFFEPSEFIKYINYVLSALACLFIGSAYGSGKIKAFLVTPIIYGVFLFAISHLIVSGDLAGIILFGSFAIWALLAIIMNGKLDRKNIKWTRNDDGVVVFSLFVWYVLAFRLHGILFGTSL